MTNRHICDATDGPWPVAIFAHNKAADIIGGSENIVRASTTHSIQVYVIANGSSDDTETLVRSFAKVHPWVKLVSITLGNKANAWNVFVHDSVPPAQIYFFADGDVQVSAVSFDALFSTLRATPEASGAVVVPVTGRDREQLERLVCEGHILLDALYTLRGDCVWCVRGAGICLLIDYIGKGGLITSLAKWNLDPAGTFLDG
jgi:hypothetical protein